MKLALNEVERRVLGALLEKSMAQPDYYPMTEKALVAACNQKQNRDPVMDLGEDEVFEALEALREAGLVTVVLPGPGARSKRYKHEVEAHYGWQKRERAVMTELLLRGPQTVGELRGRCSRFATFEDLQAVVLVLDCLAQSDPPMTRAMPRDPGRSAIRHTHLLYVEGEAPAVTPAPLAMEPAPVTLASAPQPSGPSASGLQAQIDGLQTELADIHETLADVVKRLERLENDLL